MTPTEEDNLLLDKVANGLAIASERDLAARLGMSTTSLHKIRKLGGTLSWKQRFIVMDKLGFMHIRAKVEALTPISLAKTIRQITNAGSENIIRKRIAYKTDSADSNLIEFLRTYSELSNNNIFKENLDVSENRLDKIENGSEFTWQERGTLMTALNKINPKKWIFDQQDMLKHLNSSEALLESIDKIAFPMNENQEQQNELIDRFKDLLQLDTDSDVAKILQLKRQQITQARKGRTPLSIHARYRMVCELDRINKSENPVNLEDIYELANSSENPINLEDIDELANSSKKIIERFFHQ